MADVVLQLRRAHAALSRVRELHKPVDGAPPTCPVCRLVWPCPTALATERHLGDPR